MFLDYTAKTALTAILLMATVLVAINHFVGTGENDMRPLLFILTLLTLVSAWWAWVDYKRRQAAEGEGLDAAAKAEKAASAAETTTEQAKAKVEIESIPEPEVEEKAAPEPVAEEKAAPEPTAAAEPDDLTRIEGIGPKYRDALVAGGIDTFAKLAAVSEDDIVAAAKAAGMRRNRSMPTWAEQAALAAKGDWEGLEKLQDELTGGRRG